MLRYKLIPAALERAAESLAIACNGGSWETDYTAEQKSLWRARVRQSLTQGYDHD